MTFKNDTGKTVLYPRLPLDDGGTAVHCDSVSCEATVPFALFLFDRDWSWQFDRAAADGDENFCPAHNLKEDSA